MDDKEVIAKRLTFESLAREALAQIGLERGVLRTFVDLSIRPHVVLRHYLDGSKRDVYSGPLTYLLLVLGITLFAFELLPTPLATSLEGQGYAVQDVTPFAQWFARLMTALAVPLNAALLGPLMPDLKLNYAERLAVIAFLAGHVQLLALITYPTLLLGLSSEIWILAMLVWIAASLAFHHPKRSFQLGLGAVVLGFLTVLPLIWAWTPFLPLTTPGG